MEIIFNNNTIKNTFLTVLASTGTGLKTIGFIISKSKKGVYYIKFTESQTLTGRI